MKTALLILAILAAVPAMADTVTHDSYLSLYNAKYSGDIVFTKEVYNFHYAEAEVTGGASTQVYEGNISAINDGDVAVSMLDTDPDFFGDMSMYSMVAVEDYGEAKSMVSVSQTIWFTALKDTDVTFSFDYSGYDAYLNSGSNPYDYSYAGISYNVANLTGGFTSHGFAGDVIDAYIYSPMSFTTTMTFAAGERGWISWGGAASNYINNQDTRPVPEPMTMLLFGSGLAGLAMRKFIP